MLHDKVISMNDTPSTSEEIEKRKELFEYEMTQVLLNLKGKFAKFDRENSPLRDSGLTESDLAVKYEFVPLPEVAVPSANLAVPTVEQPIAYNALDLADLELATFAQTPQAAAANVNVAFNPIAEVKVENRGPATAVPSVGVAYTPLAAVTPNIAVPVPALPVVEAYVPLSASHVASTLAEVPNAGAKTVNFVPVKHTAQKLTITTVPQLAEAPAFEPGVAPAVSEIEYAPAPAVALRYKPARKAKVKAIHRDAPTIPSVAAYAPVAASEVAALGVAVPLDSPSDSLYTPVAASEVAALNVAVPTETPKVSFAPLKAPKNAGKLAPPPVLAHVDDYVPLQQAALAIAPRVVPEANVAVTFEPGVAKDLTVAAAKVHFAKELAEPKDFYAMWLAM
jgi:hypothetical protein